jgi:hypothetical protein
LGFQSINYLFSSGDGIGHMNFALDRKLFKVTHCNGSVGGGQSLPTQAAAGGRSLPARVAACAGGASWHGRDSGRSSLRAASSLAWCGCRVRRWQKERKRMTCGLHMSWTGRMNLRVKV